MSIHGNIILKKHTLWLYSPWLITLERRENKNILYGQRLSPAGQIWEREWNEFINQITKDSQAKYKMLDAEISVFFD